MLLDPKVLGQFTKKRIFQSREIDLSQFTEIGDQADWLFVIGFSLPFFHKFQSWLEEDSKRRLIFLEPEITTFAISQDDPIFSHKQVKIHWIRNEVEVTQLAQKMGWKGVFLHLSVIDLANLKQISAPFEKVLKEFHEAARLLVSDWSDRGESIMKNSFSHWSGSLNVKSALQLKDRFKKTPAIICGAGPSLERVAPLLDRNRALIFAGGAALNRLSIEPHFSASIDRQASYRVFKRHPFSQVPSFYQTRMNQKNLSLLHGEKLYVPDSCYPSEAWIGGSEELFDGGWTVGTFLTSLAVHFGCDPIIFVGMDLCYEDQKKYAFSEEGAEKIELVETANAQGNTVSTQRDWLMAASWISQFAELHRGRTFINTSEKGLFFGDRVKRSIFEEIAFPGLIDLDGLVHAELMALQPHESPPKRVEIWKKSVERCLQLLEKPGKGLEKEIVYQKFLFPLWQIWSPIFERELEMDPIEATLEDKMRANQILFFQEVLNEQTK